MNELHYQIDLLKAMNKKLNGNEQMYRLVCETSQNAFLYYSFERNELSVLGKWNEFFNFEIKSLSDMHKIYDCVAESYRDELREVLFLESTGKEEAVCYCTYKEKRSWLKVDVHVEYDDAGKPLQKIIRIMDVTKTKRQNDELTYLAYYDSVTGLYNRNYFIQRLGELIDKANEEQEIVSVMIIDIDDFRKINDGMGMLVGDEVVQQFGSILKEFSNNSVIVGHFSSDVYCIAIYGSKDGNTVENIYSNIKEKIKTPIFLSNGLEISITVCVGVAEYPESANSVLDLIKCAEIVMFRGKADGKNTIQYFDAPILHDFLQNAQMDTKLKEAVMNSNSFSLQYQPQFYAGNKKLRGVEALIRWKDTENHLISPGIFIPIAEKNGTIIPIGNWVLEESIRQYAEWKRKYQHDMIMSINVSAIQYMKDDFEENLISIIEKYKVVPSDIEVEVTESVLIEDFEVVAEKLRNLRRYGVRVSLDDFGTGFSSLSYLKKLPIDTLKIDKSFIDTVLTDSPTRVITESIIRMVKTLGFEAIAEGVEEEEQYEYLHAIGCDVIQGYYLGKPQSVADIENLLQME